MNMKVDVCRPARCARGLFDNGKRSRAFVFTLNNYQPGSWDDLVAAVDGKASYMVASWEVGASGTPHLQGYLHWKQQITFKALHNALPKDPPIWIRAARSPIHAEAYCRKPNKDGSYKRVESFGVMPHQGSRSDIAGAFERVRDGASLIEIADDSPETFTRCHAALRWYATSRMQPYAGRRDAYWLTGPSGAGKSTDAKRRAYIAAGGPEGVTPEEARAFYAEHVYSHSGSSDWFDGYNNQKVAVFDEMYIDNSTTRTSSNQITVKRIIALAGDSPCRVQVKGGVLAWNARTIFFTSTQALDPTFYPNKGKQTIEVVRRVHVIKMLPSPDFHSGAAAVKEATDAVAQAHPLLHG